MKGKIVLMGVAALLAAAAVGAAPEVPEWKVRPWEIMRGLKPRAAVLWQLDRDSLKGWTVKGAKSELSETDVTKLWGEKVAKVHYAQAGSVTIRPPQPIPVPADADGVEVWFYGPAAKGFGSLPSVSYMLADASGARFRVPGSGMGSRWASHAWWGASLVRIPAAAKRPVKLVSFLL